MIADDGGEVVDIPITEVKGHKNNVDGSVTFKMFGGPYHNLKVRVYKPFMRVVFEHPKHGTLVYELHPPVRKRGTWVYTYNPDDKEPYRPDEQGDIKWSQTVNDRWAKWRAWKAQEEDIKLAKLAERTEQ